MKKWKLLLGTALVSVALLGCAKTNQPSSPEEAKKLKQSPLGILSFLPILIQQMSTMAGLLFVTELVKPYLKWMIS